MAGTDDAAFLAAVLGEVPDKPACLRSLHRVLRPGGLLVVQEFFPDPDRMRVPEVRRLAEPAGFRFIESHGHPWRYTVRSGEGRTRHERSRADARLGRRPGGGR